MVCGFAKNVTHPQKTLAMIGLIFADRKDNKNDSSDNILQQFSFANDCLADDKTMPSETQSNSDLDTSSSTDDWKVFNKRDLHLIHLNISSILSKID